MHACDSNDGRAHVQVKVAHLLLWGQLSRIWRFLATFVLRLSETGWTARRGWCQGLGRCERSMHSTWH